MNVDRSGKLFPAQGGGGWSASVLQSLQLWVSPTSRSSCPPPQVRPHFFMSASKLPCHVFLVPPFFFLLRVPGEGLPCDVGCRRTDYVTQPSPASLQDYYYIFIYLFILFLYFFVGGGRGILYSWKMFLIFFLCLFMSFLCTFAVSYFIDPF